MAPIVVEPKTLADAGVSINGVGDELATALSTLASSLPSSALAGHDAAGIAFGLAYQQAGQALLDAGAAAANGGRKVGFGVQMSATNYSRADASSTIGGSAAALSPPSAPGEVNAPTMPSLSGGGVAEPFLWSMVEMLVGGIWPDGDPAQLRSAAEAWSTFASTLSGIGAELQGPSATIAGQQIPEGDAMATALSDLTKGLNNIATESGKLATQTSEFATDVESTQNAIRDLLGRVSPSGIFDALGAVFSGDAMEELREVAEDIRTVLDNLKRQADARQGSIGDVKKMIDDAVVSLERKARKEFTDYLGDDVGNAVATTFDTSLNLREGLLLGGLGAFEDLQQLNPLRFTYDFEGAKGTWGAMLETNFNASLVGAIIDPETAAHTQQEMLKDVVHAEDWTTDRPGLGAGENLFDAGSALLGGAGAARAGTRAAGEAADAAEGAAPGVRAAGALENAVTETSGIAGRVEGITDELDSIGDEISRSATPNPSGPPVPRGLVEPPETPRIPDSPGTRDPELMSPDTPSSPSVDKSSTTLPHSTGPTQSDLPPTPQSSAETATLTSTEQQVADRAATSPNPHSAPSPARESATGGTPAPNFSGESSQASPTESAAEALPSTGESTAAGAERLEPAADGNDPSTDSTEHHDDSSTDGEGHHSPLQDGPYAVDDDGHYLPGSLPSYEELLEVTKSDPDSAHYWSGRDAAGAGVGPEGSGIAERIAEGTNGATLEMTLQKNGIDPLPVWNRHDPESVRFWEEASAAFAENASGEVTATIGRDLRNGNIWQGVEIPRLVENIDVIRIVQIDPDTGLLTIVFERER